MEYKLFTDLIGALGKVNIQLHTSDDEFLREDARLNDWNEWMQTGGTFNQVIICRLTHLAEGTT